MSDEKASGMSANIGKRVRYYVIFFSILILFLIWGSTILQLVTVSLSGNKDQSELAQKTVASIITALGAIGLILINLGRDINLHNFVDRTFFGVRKKTGQVIHRQMIDAAQAVGANCWQNMSQRPRDITRLFYHFANEQETLRAYSFTLWEQYFVNIYIVCFALIGFVISTLVVLFRWRLDFTAFTPLVFLAILAAIGLSTRYSLLKKLYDLPVQQIEEIRTSKAEELRQQVESRFCAPTP